MGAITSVCCDSDEQSKNKSNPTTRTIQRQVDNGN
jgi:hypothetical protein